VPEVVVPFGKDEFFDLQRKARHVMGLMPESGKAGSGKGLPDDLRKRLELAPARTTRQWVLQHSKVLVTVMLVLTELQEKIEEWER
jgi:hypothetical protein